MGDPRPWVGQELEVFVRHRPAVGAVDVVDVHLQERREPAEPLALDEPHVGLVVLCPVASAAGADGMPALFA